MSHDYIIVGFASETYRVVPSPLLEHVFTPEDCLELRKGKLHTEEPDCLPMSAYGEVIGLLNIDLRGEGTTREVSQEELDELRHFVAHFEPGRKLTCS